MPSNNYIYKMSNAGGMSTVTRYTDMLAGNAVWNPWEPQGAYDALSTVTLSANTTSVTVAGIPSGYKHLQIRMITRVGTGSGTSFSGISLLCNEDAGSNYTYHRIIGNGSSASADGSGTFNYIIAGYAAQNGLLAGNFSSTILDVLDYSSTAKNKTFRILSGYDNNGSGSIIFGSGVWLNTSAISTLTLKDVTFGINSQFTLYGIR